MAWGRKSAPPPPPPPKSWTSLIPFILLLIFLSVFAFITYHIWLTISGVGAAAAQKMEKRNVALTKDGVKVGVRHISEEEARDKAQRGVMKAWNLSSWPGYKSRLFGVNIDKDSQKTA